MADAGMSSPAEGPAATPLASTPTKVSPKPKRPNYNVIHADPLPVTLYHAPPLIPHNPLSLLHHIFLYFFPPIPSHKLTYTGAFSPRTLSVEITDPKAILDLWQRGFWGKGSLSRSEPTWLHREMRRLGDTHVGETSEEVTKRRRDQRKEMKKERAKKEKEELQKVKEAESKKDTVVSNGKPPTSDSKVVVHLEEELQGLNELVTQPINPHSPIQGTGLPTPPLSVADEVVNTNGESSTAGVVVDGANGSLILTASEPPTTESPDTTPQHPKVVRFNPVSETKVIPVEKRVVIENQEHLQLTLVESFFLAYALGVLSVTSSSSNPLPLSDLFTLFLRYSSFPPLPEAAISLDKLNPDNKFLINYVVYHHFRSLGWVVKTGVKFSVDYLLYKRGPVFSHAEFAILIVPDYSRWEGRKVEGKEWHWLHSITRVNSQVKKTVVLVYVDIPTPSEIEGWEREEDGLKGLFAKYRIKEVALRRWIPGRNRD